MRRYTLLILLLGLVFLPGCGGVDDYFDDECFTCDDYYYDDNNLPPLQAVDDFYETAADTTIFVNADNGVLVNDTFFDAFIAFPETTSRGGQLVGNGDGSFTYTPPAAFAGTDSFVYVLSDDFGESAAVVTITINSTGQPNPGIFVDSASGNDATANPATGAPFATLNGALAQAGANAEIVIRPGTGQPYSGNVTLLNGQSLIGAGFLNVTPQGQNRPILSGTVDLANGNLIRGLSFQSTSGDAINGDNSQGATISNCVFANSSNGGRAISGDSASGAWVIAGNSINAMDDAGIRLSSSGNQSLSAEIDGNTITNCQLSAISLLSEGSSTFTTSVTDNVMTGNENGFTFDALVIEASSFRLNLEGNSNDDDYLLSTLNLTGLFEVENLSTLQQRNISGTVVLDEDPGSTPITEIPDNTISL
jgi:hypothetical protein